MLSPCDSKSIVPVIQEANKAGIPVFTVDIPCSEPGVKIVTQIATDNYGAGCTASHHVVGLSVPTRPRALPSASATFIPAWCAVWARRQSQSTAALPDGGDTGRT